MESLRMIIPILLISWLFICSWQDIKRKQISIILIVAGFAVIFISSLICGNLSVWNRLAGLSLGILLLGMNPITRGQIGMGDGLIVCATGLCLGFSKNSMLLIYALFASAIISIILLVLFKANRKMMIPFVPFLLIGYLGVLVI